MNKQEQEKMVKAIRMDNRNRIRCEFWRAAYIVYAQNTNNVGNRNTRLADEALEDFDERFYIDLKK